MIYTVTSCGAKHANVFDTMERRRERCKDGSRNWINMGHDVPITWRLSSDR